MLLNETATHVTLARELLAAPTPENLRYAALELRMAIEAAFYRLVPLYEDELSDDMLREWQPRRILDALVEIDPGVAKDKTVRIGLSSPLDESLRPFMANRQRSVTRKLLRDYYHKLGSYLHARRSSDRPISLPHVETFLKAAASRLEEHCHETTILAKVHPSVTVQCDCGRTFKRSMHAVRTTGVAFCPSPHCRAIYDVTETADGAHVNVRQIEFVCPRCRASSFFPVHKVHAGIKFACLGCRARFEIHEGLWVAAVGPESGAA